MSLVLTTRDDHKIVVRNYFDGLIHLRITFAEEPLVMKDVVLYESDANDLIHMLREAH